MAPPTAKYEVKRSALSTDFGLQLAQRWFGLSPDQLSAKYGTYKNGPRKGLIRGYIYWVKIQSGGWVYRPYSEGGGFVLHPGRKIRFITTDFNADVGQGNLLYGMISASCRFEETK